MIWFSMVCRFFRLSRRRFLLLVSLNRMLRMFFCVLFSFRSCVSRSGLILEMVVWIGWFCLLSRF